MAQFFLTYWTAICWGSVSLDWLFLCGTVWAFWWWSFLKGDLKNIFHIVETPYGRSSLPNSYQSVSFFFFFLFIEVFVVWSKRPDSGIWIQVLNRYLHHMISSILLPLCGPWFPHPKTEFGLYWFIGAHYCWHFMTPHVHLLWKDYWRSGRHFGWIFLHISKDQGRMGNLTLSHGALGYKYPSIVAREIKVKHW